MRSKLAIWHKNFENIKIESVIHYSRLFSDQIKLLMQKGASGSIYQNLCCRHFRCDFDVAYIVVDWIQSLKQFYINVSYEPVHEISNNVVCATSKASDQPAHTHSLIRDFACHFNIL